MNRMSRGFNTCNFISTRSQVFEDVGVLKNYAKFTWKHWYWSQFLTKLKASYFQPVTFVKKETPARVFSFEFCEIFKKTFPIEQLYVTAFVTAFVTLLKYDFDLLFTIH